MSWVRVDDAFPMHPKAIGLSDEAVALWLRGLCYSNMSRTDGAIPSAALPILSRARKPAKVAAELVAARLWDATPNGWQVHDFAGYQATAETRARLTEEKSQRQKSWRERRSVDASTSSLETPRSASVDAGVDTAPLPTPHPHPLPTPPPTPCSDLERAPAAPTKDGPAKGPRRKPTSALPTGDALAAWLTEHEIPDPATDTEAAKFLDHHRARDSRFVDWASAWRNWKRNAAAWAKPGTAARPPWKSPVQPISDAWAPNTGEYEDLPEGRIF